MLSAQALSNECACQPVPKLIYPVARHAGLVATGRRTGSVQKPWEQASRLAHAAPVGQLVVSLGHGAISLYDLETQRVA